jgi:hypothetical protein
MNKDIFIYRSTIVIYCEHPLKPVEWDDSWCGDGQVYWGVSKKDIIEQNSIQYLMIDNEAIVTLYVGNEIKVKIPSTIKVQSKICDVTGIGQYAFSTSSTLRSLTIPESVTTIENYATLGLIVYCESKTSYDNIYYQSIAYYGINETNYIELDGVEYVIIDGEAAATSYIGNGIEVSIPSTIEIQGNIYSVTKIGSNAFSNHLGLEFEEKLFLKSIFIPESVTSIGISALDISGLIVYCESKTSYDNIYYQSIAYYGINETNYIELDGVEYVIIDGEAVVTSYKKNESAVSIPSTIEIQGKTYSVTSVGSYAFYNCSNLINLQIPDTITNIGADAFEGCDNLNLNEYEGVLYLGNKTNPYLWVYELNNDELEDVVLHDGTIGILEFAFNGCFSIKTVNIPDTIKSIGGYAFRDCFSLESIKIPSGVSSIGEFAFAYCDTLTIYSEASSKPSGWNSNWNYSNKPVYWAGQWEYDGNGNPVPLE